MLAVSGEDSALFGPNFYVVAGVVLVEKLARLRERCRVMWQFADFERYGSFIVAAEWVVNIDI